MVPVQPDLTEDEHKAIYREYLQRYYSITPQLATLGEDAILELLQQCDQQLSYQCSIMASSLAAG
ncbi:MAG: hypothetical protein AAF821_27510 [Cyanobacteria bacterium P01_D01_bin.156]